MKISLLWLKEWVEIELGPEALSDALSNAGFEVESIQYEDKYLHKIVVAEVISAEPHPNADKLRVTQARIGGGEELQIVTAATNVQVGNKVPLALIGARLAEDFEIKKAKLRGVDSFGMYCSEKELGMAKESSGVLILPADAPVGMEIADFLEKRDVVLEVSSTANRGDCLSYQGIAREVGAITAQPLKRSLPPFQEPRQGSASIQLENQSSEDCKLYYGRVLAGVQVQESPSWLKRKLLSSGMRPINNVVDITNYVMLESGQPLHAFDLDEIRASVVKVRSAEEGEMIKTLDGVERVLSSKDLVIADGTGPLALAGLMGGERGEVNAKTQRIFLEAAYFLPAAVRKSSKRHNLRTEASHRFERGVDPNGVIRAMDEATRHIMELTGGKVLGEDRLSRTEDFADSHVELRIPRVNQLLGTDLSLSQIQGILSRLQFECHPQGDRLSVKIPSFRREDVTREADLIEEVSRLFGYQNIPVTLPQGWGRSRVLPEQQFKSLIRSSLSAKGMKEVVTYSLVSAPLCQKVLLDYPVADLIPVANPLTEDYALMRDSLIPSLLEVAQRNRNRQQADLLFYEVGKIFLRTERGFEERLRICGLATGEMISSWSQAKVAADFFALKGIVESLLDELGIGWREYLVLDQDHRFHPSRSAMIRSRGKTLGCLGEVDPRVAARFDLSQKTYLFDLDFEILTGESSMHRKYYALPQFPAISRDLAFIVEARVSHQALSERIQKEGQDLLREVSLFDYYVGEPVPEGFKSMAYSLTFRAPDKTLTDEEVNPVLHKIIISLEKNFRIQLRSS